jgi:hypothetical protein
MRRHVGYELTFNCPQPIMMVCLLDAHRRSRSGCNRHPARSISVREDQLAKGRGIAMEAKITGLSVVNSSSKF